MRRSALIGLSLTVLAGLGVVLCVVNGDLAATVFFVSYGGAGAYLAARRSANAIGWLLLATG